MVLKRKQLMEIGSNHMHSLTVSRVLSPSELPFCRLPFCHLGVKVMPCNSDIFQTVIEEFTMNTPYMGPFLVWCNHVINE